MSRQNLEDNLTRRQRHNSPRFGSLRLALKADFIILPDGPAFYTFDPGVVDRLVIMPNVLSNGGQWYLIGNVGTPHLNLVDSLGVALGAVSAGQVALVYSAPGSWNVMVLSAASSFLSIATVTAGASYNTLAADDVILVKKTIGSATTINLPASTAKRGLYLIKDGKGDTIANPITILPNGAELIDNAANVVINMPFGSAQILSVPGLGLFLTNFG